MERIKTAFKRPYKSDHKMTDSELAFADGYNKCRDNLLQLIKDLQNDLQNDLAKI